MFLLWVAYFAKKNKGQSQHRHSQPIIKINFFCHSSGYSAMFINNGLKATVGHDYWKTDKLGQQEESTEKWSANN